MNKGLMMVGRVLDPLTRWGRRINYVGIGPLGLLCAKEFLLGSELQQAE